MIIQPQTAERNRTETGAEMHRFMGKLYPICRSLTGEGVRRTLEAVRGHVPLEIREIPTGTQVFDWTVPEEWNVRDAFVKDEQGNRVIDFRRSNLHLVGYSEPVRRTMTWCELKEHLHTLPEHPDWIPYRTSYYERTWGFCLSHHQFEELDKTDRQERRYEVVVDTTLAPGSLSYGELLLPGRCEDEVVVACHTCHPSLANDGLSGIAVATWLVRRLADRTNHYSYRFLYLPGTVGPIAWLALNEHRVDRIKHGLVLALVGDAGPSTYKRSRRGDAEIDRAAAVVLKHGGVDDAVVDFEPYGYHERQFCSPGFNLPVGCLMRTPYGQYAEYHTSADDLSRVRPESLADSLAKCEAIVDVLEQNRKYRNLNPKCEPQLGRRGLYSATCGGRKADAGAVLWVLNFSDGEHSLLDIAERSGLAFGTVRDAAEALLRCGLLEPCEKPRTPPSEVMP